MDFTAHLAAIAGSVAFKLKALEGKLCAKGVLTILKSAITDALAVAKEVEAAPGDKRLFLEGAAATAFDTVWTNISLPFPLNTLQTAYLTKTYIRPAAVRALDFFVDEAFAEIAPIASNAVVQEVVSVAENVAASTVTVTTAVVNTPPTT